MNRLQVLAACAAIVCGAGGASAQHSDIVLVVQGGRLATVDDTTFESARVYEGELGELGIPGFTDDPGYASESLAPDSLVGYDVADDLLFWDGSAFVAPPEDERMEIRLGSTVLTTVNGTSGFQSGAWFAQAGGGGDLHTHLSFYAKHPTFNPGNPFVNPISDGAYVLLLQQTSDVHDASETYAILFNQNLPTQDFEQAVAAAQDLFAPGCPGDLDGDGAVGLSDLSALLTNFGVMSGATFEDGDLNGDGAVSLADLSELLTYFGVTC